MHAVLRGIATRTTLPTVAAAVTVPLAFGRLATPLAAVVGLFAVVTAVVFGPAVGILVTHVLAAAVVSELSALDLVWLEVGLAPLLAAPLAGRAHGRDAVIAWLTAIGAGGVVTLVATGTDDLWVIALAVITVGALGVYGVHRVELVVLRLVAEESPGGGR
ncbi:hypothetical protein [Halobaculum sp. EA56]|uniref:hypothetical protein n=1 Tax=Halobaculum sp. EA56 TaxID=3421648 RepID=UPI003EBE5055